MMPNGNIDEVPEAQDNQNGREALEMPNGEGLLGAGDVQNVFLYEALDDPSTPSLRLQRRQYVRQEHVRFLRSRLRIFDEYLVTRRGEAFLDFIKLLPNEFENLYQRIGSRLEHFTTHAGPISGRHRLMVYLRYVTQGITFKAYALDIGISISTVAAIVREVTEAIIIDMHSEAFPRIKRGKFIQVARITQERYDYPRAVGFLDGKHIHIKKPARSGSIFYNYQHYNSIILLALCDCDHRIIAYDVGAPGRADDAGVLRDSALKRFLDRHDNVFPLTTELGNVGPVQYHILVNGGFGQGHRFIRPYREAEADTPDKRRFNKQLSGARQIIEQTFGLLAQRFQVLMYRMNLDPVQTQRLVISLMILHNLLPRRQDSLEAVQRFEPAPNAAYHPLEREEPEAGTESANRARERLTQYYIDKDGPARS
ncbi:unnamed protein product [Cylicocyclus nassatus]|uniref:DDE Tnp4 domain-containing protein n=1 Tax=Cylicocyclus nassatus TaxID=53992 RepID=A0AA36H9T9_CYLNA|nr:unnamed protein product [Cylicocyclus nassatus]